MAEDRYIIANRITKVEQNVDEKAWNAIKANKRMSSWFLKEKLVSTPAKSIPPAGVVVTPPADTATEKPYNEMTLEELKAECDAKDIKYKKTAKEADLLTLLGIE